MGSNLQIRQDLEEICRNRRFNLFETKPTSFNFNHNFEFVGEEVQSKNVGKGWTIL